MNPLLNLKLDDFRALLGDDRRCFLAWDPERSEFVISSPVLEPLATAVAHDERDFDAHEAVFMEFGAETGSLFGVFLHHTVRGQGAGGVRHWPYETIGAFVRDGLRLSRAMGRKNALAGLWWGGGKGIIARQSGDRHRDATYRRTLYQEYGRFISSLRGAYVTAEDVGTTAADMAEVFRTTRFTTCVPPEVGGSGNPSPVTARGVVCAMEAALDYLGLGSIDGKRVAMQGTGNVGSAMIDLLLDRGVSRIIATEISDEHAAAIRSRFEGKPLELRVVSPEDRSIFAEECDIFAPNALGGVLNPETIPMLRTKVVCGAANNQLLDERRDDRLLADRGIAYVPDFVANRMGIVNCANEQYGSIKDDPAILRHYDPSWESSIFSVTRAVLERATREGITAAQAANALADELGREPHPIFGHRTRSIVRALVRDEWHRAPVPE